ncbi:hypothetical protein [Mycobacterium sp. SM3041]|uniref:hypothetical protein n=1 Tax=Mycobacterium sp. SM3041 TaxID=3114291 RepID=UPI003204D6D3
MLTARRKVKAGVPISRFVDRTIRPAAPPEESCSFGQLEAREERRKGFGRLVHYDAFDLASELRDQCGPLAGEIARLVSVEPLKDPRALEVGQPDLWFPGYAVIAVATAVCQLRADLVAAMVPHANDELRERLSALVISAGFRAPLAVDNDLLRTGYWLDGLVAIAAPLSTDLAELVAAQAPRKVSVLDRAISDALRGPDARGFDHYVRLLAEEIPKLRRNQEAHRRIRAWEAERAAAAESDRTRDALRQLGLS